jgi:hypothetical protein
MTPLRVRLRSSARAALILRTTVILRVVVPGIHQCGAQAAPGVVLLGQRATNPYPRLASCAQFVRSRERYLRVTEQNLYSRLRSRSEAYLVARPCPASAR